jgi:hypothetical protein
MKLDERIPSEELFEQELSDPAFRAEWERLAPARALAYRLGSGIGFSMASRRLRLPGTSALRWRRSIVWKSGSIFLRVGHWRGFAPYKIPTTI